MLFTLGAIVVGILTIRDRLPDVPSDAGGTLLWVLSLIDPDRQVPHPGRVLPAPPRRVVAHRAMAIGTSLLALGPVLSLASRYLGDWFDSILPPPEDQPWLNPFSIAMQVAVSAIAILAIVYMARGLVEARQYADRPGMRRWWAWSRSWRSWVPASAWPSSAAISSGRRGRDVLASYLLTLLGVVLNAVTVVRMGVLHRGPRSPVAEPARTRTSAGSSRPSPGACILALFLVSGVQSMLAYLMQVNSRRTSRSCCRPCQPSPISHCWPRSPSGCRRRTRRSTSAEDEAGADGVPRVRRRHRAIAAPDDLAGSTA